MKASTNTDYSNNVILHFLIKIKNVIQNIFYCAYIGLKFVFHDTYKKFPKNRKNSESKEKTNKIVQKIVEWYNSLEFAKKQHVKLLQMRENLLVDLQNEGSIRSEFPQVFQYKARNKDGRLEVSTINGYSKLDVNTFLIEEGYTVYDIKTNKTIGFLYGETSIFATKMSNKDLLFWLTQLSTYIKSGITLTDSVKILNNQMRRKKKYNKYFQSIIYELTMGTPFSKALEKQGILFPALLINMIRAAEATGELEETLSDMAEYYEEVEKTHKQMISAITYPTIILFFAVAVITFILIFVIPDFVGIYKSSGAEIRGITLAIVNISDFLKTNIFLLISLFILAILIILFCYKNIKAFRKKLQYFFMHIPILGKIMIYSELTIFTKTFASLLTNNVFITDSMTILGRITNNEIYKEIMNDTVDNIVKGEKISSSFKDHWAIPEVAYYMLVTGESTGKLAEMMQKVSSYYSEMHRSLVSNLKAFIEPVLISILAIVVGLIILAVIIPMFEVIGSIE